MRHCLRLALALIPVAGSAQPLALPPAPIPVAAPAAAPAQDPLLEQLLQATLRQHPDLARAQALVEAEGERIPQASALADPTLTLGLQNDGFKRLMIGEMDSSYYQVMLTQPLSWPGKRGLRSELAKLGVKSARTTASRIRLSLVADLQRAYYGLLLVRGQLELLEQQGLFWRQAGALTKARYEVGQGAQADLLRSQLEQNRLQLAKLSLASEERILLARLNRLRGASADAALPTTARLGDLAFPDLGPAQWLERAEQESPELAAAQVGASQAERSLELAKRDRYPDFAITAAVMPRGVLDPMWQVGVSVSLPLWSRHKQQRAVAEQETRRRAQGADSQNVRNLLAQRIQERSAQWEAALATLQLYRQGLLIQSEASFQASLAQYEAGRTPFLGVLEALNGWSADQGGYLQALAQAQAVRIAQEEFTLAETPGISAQSLGAGSMAAGGSPGGAAPASTPAKSGSAAAPAGGAAMKSM